MLEQMRRERVAQARAGSASARRQPSVRSSLRIFQNPTRVRPLPRLALTKSQGDVRLPSSDGPAAVDVLLHPFGRFDRQSARCAACCPCRCTTGIPRRDSDRCARRWISSETRMPVAYSTSISARSRRPRGVATSGCWISRSTSSTPRNFGRAGHARGACRSSAGLRVRWTVRARKSGRSRVWRRRFVPPSAARGLRSSGRRRNPRDRGGRAAETVFRHRRRILQDVADRGRSSQACDRPDAARP